MGFVIVMVGAVYLLISFGVVVWAVNYAKKHDKSPIRWGWGAALGMYLLVFWDWIPTVVTHKYYCSTEAGFWVYKTPEQWKKGNPGVMETLVANKGAPFLDEKFDDGHTTTYFLNDRFNWLVKINGPSFPNMWRHEQEVVDSKTSEVLARYIDYSTAQGAYSLAWHGWRMWLYNEHCNGGGQNQDALRNFRDNFYGNKK